MSLPRYPNYKDWGVEWLGEVCLAHLARIIKVDLKSELFSYSIDERALKHARLMDGHRSSTPLLRFFDFSRPARQ